MSIVTKLNVKTRDAQNYLETVSFFITPLAFAAAQDIPTTVLIEAFINAVFAPFASNLISTSKVYAYSVEIEEDDAGIGGEGAVATSIAAKLRSGIGVYGNPDPFGTLEGVEMRIPGLNKNGVIFDPVNPNSFTTSGGNFPAMRTALVNLGYQVSGGPAFGSAQIFETGVAFNGKRAPKRTR